MYECPEIPDDKLMQFLSQRYIPEFAGMGKDDLFQEMRIVWWQMYQKKKDEITDPISLRKYLTGAMRKRMMNIMVGKDTERNAMQGYQTGMSRTAGEAIDPMRTPASRIFNPDANLQKVDEDASSWWDNYEDDVPTTEDQIADEDEHAYRLKEVYAAINELPEVMGLAILYRTEGLTYQEIADKLGFAHFNSARAYYSKALRKLKESVNGE